MTRILFAIVAVLTIAAGVAECACLAFGVGRVHDVVRHRERHVERGHLRLAPALRGGGCIGTTAGAGCLGRVGSGCSGFGGPALVAPTTKVVPVPMPPKK